MKTSSLPPRSKPIKRSAPPKRVNAKRKRSEFARCYGSKARCAFIASLPCSACHVVGYSENAHVMGNGGLSRKGDHTTIAPLCGYRQRSRLDYDLGCHEMLHAFGRSYFTRKHPDFDAAKAARETQNAWENFAAHRGTPDE